MSVNKFGVSLRIRRGRDATSGGLRASVESLRNYVRDNALCLTASGVSSSASHYDARSLRIRGLAWPTDDDDATNKSYVTRIMRDVKVEASKFREDVDARTMLLGNSADHSARRIVALYKRIDALESAATERSSALETGVTQIRAREDALENRMRTLENLQELTATKIEVAEAARSTSQTRAATDKRLSDLESFVEANCASEVASNERLRDLETSVTRIDEKTEKRVRALERSMSHVNNLAANNERNRAALSDHDRTLQELMAKTATSNAKLRELDAEVSRLRKDANEFARRTSATTAATATAAAAAIPRTIDPNKVVIKLDAKTPDKRQPKRE